mgnify:FL=1
MLLLNLNSIPNKPTQWNEESCYNTLMKTQKIRVRNLSESLLKSGVSVHVKPVPVLTGFIAAGAIIVIANSSLILTGLGLILAGVFGIAIFPDRILVTFLDDCLVLFNQPDRSMCMLVYYDEVVHWQYVYRKHYDQLVITLVDGSTEVQEMYSYSSVYQQLSDHLAGKQLKSIRIRKENA